MGSLRHQLPRPLQPEVPRAGRRGRLGGNLHQQGRRLRRGSAARLPARSHVSPLARQPRSHQLPHETRRQARRGQVRADLVGRSRRHDRQRTQAHHRRVRQRVRVHSLCDGRELHDGALAAAFHELPRRFPGVVRRLQRHADGNDRAPHLRRIRLQRQHAQRRRGRRAHPRVRHEPDRDAPGRRRVALRLGASARDHEGQDDLHRPPHERFRHGPFRRVAAHQPRHRRRALFRHRA